MRNILKFWKAIHFVKLEHFLSTTMICEIAHSRRTKVLAYGKLRTKPIWILLCDNSFCERIILIPTRIFRIKHVFFADYRPLPSAHCLALYGQDLAEGSRILRVLRCSFAQNLEVSRDWLASSQKTISTFLHCYRISVVFRVRSAQRVKITDNNLMKRLFLIALTFSSYLTIRTVVSPPEVIVSKTDQNLKAFLCSTDYWDYCQAGGKTATETSKNCVSDNRYLPKHLTPPRETLITIRRNLSSYLKFDMKYCFSCKALWKSQMVRKYFLTREIYFCLVA